ncbi:MAG: aspartate carbamoyltransferase regulatory subunit [Planctomycetota bacterium]|jgi:aspartate carbamoyltransferase regulatory subunit
MTDPRRTMQVEAIANGTVVDHIPAAVTLRVAELLGVDTDQLMIGVNLRSSKLGRKGVIKVAGRELCSATLSRIALLAPRATICIIRDYQVTGKAAIPVPASFNGVAACPNVNCITNHEEWPTEFAVTADEPLTLRCHHCERRLHASDLRL